MSGDDHSTGSPRHRRRLIVACYAREKIIGAGEFSIPDFGRYFLLVICDDTNNCFLYLLLLARSGRSGVDEVDEVDEDKSVRNFSLSDVIFFFFFYYL